jgi:hypothetical protein
MRVYDPGKTLISIHIPKCAGQSIRQVLQKWFGNDFYTHYYQTHNSPPEKVVLRPGMCIHGHFNKERRLGVADYYPNADQFITFLRNPLDIHVSNYFFWKQKARRRQIELGIICEGGEHDYRSIEDFFSKRPESHMLQYFPAEITRSNYVSMVDSLFVFVGIAEKMDLSVQRLAQALNFKPVIAPRINTSEKDEWVADKTKERFMENNQLAFALYRYAAQQL